MRSMQVKHIMDEHQRYKKALNGKYYVVRIEETDGEFHVQAIDQDGKSHIDTKVKPVKTQKDREHEQDIDDKSNAIKDETAITTLLMTLGKLVMSMCFGINLTEGIKHMLMEIGESKDTNNLKRIIDRQGRIKTVFNLNDMYNSLYQRKARDIDLHEEEYIQRIKTLNLQKIHTRERERDED